MIEPVTPLFISRHVQPPSFPAAACGAGEWLDWWLALRPHFGSGSCLCRGKTPLWDGQTARYGEGDLAIVFVTG